MVGDPMIVATLVLNVLTVVILVFAGINMRAASRYDRETAAYRRGDLEGGLWLREHPSWSQRTCTRIDALVARLRRHR